ncbi:ABC transporter ATP-binding protein [Oscillochloris sp. ZM17-4]|uniref:ABC transporter ATP-binding protein n=1 Tax=Oscillochloris sp. ZM17-4 TaxID=2866714 RepID=UPI001C73CAA9|nr:ABC transporter ATP-binding protein [Oscillochloris sp. ZM17-4]MBX0331016.1 ABC transporter ATP-binding protein [Oscillochloris sp. ZM17-4]
MTTPHHPQPLIDVQGVHKSYQLGPTSIPALRGVSFRVRPGEFVAVVGPSGSGKSTLLNMIAGVDKLSAGEVLVGGRPIHRLREAERARWRGASLGIVFQFFQMLPTMTLLANVMLPMELSGTYTPAARRARAEELLGRVGLAEHIHKLPSRVSGGQQQRAAVARALANDPPLILGDEPTGNLDSGSAEVVFTLFAELVAAGKTVLMVTQDEALAARMPRRIELGEGLVRRDSAEADDA